MNKELYHLYKEEYDNILALIEELMNKPNRTDNDHLLLKILAINTVEFDDIEYPIGEVSAEELRDYFLESNGKLTEENVRWLEELG